MFINEVSLQGQYSTQKEFEEAAGVIISINKLKKQHISTKNIINTHLIPTTEIVAM